MATTTTQDGASVYYETTGTGTPVVLVHGITESCRTWDPVRDRLVDAGYRVIAPDLRGHGQSSPHSPYDLGSLAGDIIAVVTTEGLSNPRVVGHSLGGAVVSALAGAFPVESAVNVDQSLKLDDFQDQLKQAEPALRDPASFPMVIEGLFGQLAGDAIPAEEWQRVQSIRRADQDVVLGVWDLVLTAPREELAAAVEGAASGVSCPYLSLHGIDPGDEYKDWLQQLVPQAEVEIWRGLGHYPHLVEPDRFVSRLQSFWGD